MGFVYNGQQYVYRKNLQGDIIAILDRRGNVVVEYTYDAWGRNTCIDNTTVNLGTLNPFRYRGYYFDTETGLYYLNTRYYDAAIGRFISIDGIEYLDPETINGLNLYAYCNNNPVMNIDPNGNKWWKKFWSVVGAVAVVTTAVVVSVVTWGTAAPVLIGVGVAAAAYTAGQVYEYAMTGSFEWSWGGFAGAIAGGAWAGLLSFTSLSVGVSNFLAGALINAGTMIGENVTGEAKHSVLDIMVTSIFAGGISAVSAGVMNKIKIPGLTAGRGSFSSISKQITTKFQKHLIQRISVKTFSKIFAYESYNGIFGDWINAGLDALGWKAWFLRLIP